MNIHFNLPDSWLKAKLTSELLALEGNTSLPDQKADLVLYQSTDIQATSNFMSDLVNTDVKVLFLGTSKIYSPKPDGYTGLRFTHKPIHETYPFSLDENSPPELLQLFTCENIIKEMGKIYNIRSAQFHLGCIIGYPLEDQEGFVAAGIKAYKKDEPFKIYGHNGKQVRDYLHYKDLVKAVLDFYYCPDPIFGEVYNIGGGEENALSVNEFVLHVSNHYKADFKTEYVEEVKDNRLFYITDGSKAFNDLGFKPEIRLVNTIREYIHPEKLKLKTWNEVDSYLLKHATPERYDGDIPVYRVEDVEKLNVEFPDD